jgi:predicted RNA-binding protein associated with RNAse of E/G family
MMDIEEIVKRLTDLENKVDQIDIRLTTVEKSVAETLDLFGDYKNRTVEELTLMNGQIDALIRTVDSLVTTSENTLATERAKNLRRRLLNNKTRIDKQLNSRQRHG